MTSGTPKFVSSLIVESGGKIVGRTRLQKMVCMLSIAGLDVGFDFSYHHYGPYSEDLSLAVSDADALGLLDEAECQTEWGGRYSVFEANDGEVVDAEITAASPLLRVMCNADSVELELAVTAAFLNACGEENPWEEVRRRKSQKATVLRVRNAQELYSKIRDANPFNALPTL